MMQWVVECGPDGGAEPGSRASAVVGGREYAVGGWGEYEAARRAERAAASEGFRPGSLYAEPHGAPRPGALITPADAVASLMEGALAARGGGGPADGPGRAKTALRRAAERLAEAMGAMEDALCNPDEDGVWECASAETLRRVGPGARPGALPGRALGASLVIPPLTSADLRDLIADPRQEIDADSLWELGAAAGSVAASLGVALPALPGPSAAGRRAGLPEETLQAAPADDDSAVLRLEAAVLPRVADLEELQASIATRLDSVAGAVEAAIRRGSGR